MTSPNRIVITALLVVSATTASCSQLPVHSSAICPQLAVFAKSIGPGESRSVRLSRRGSWMVDHVKSCDAPEGGPAADKLCSWLLDHTSTEYMEANINGALSCLQGQKLVGIIGGTGLTSWSGKAHFSNPRLDVDNLEVDLIYDFPACDCDEQYLQFTLTMRKPQSGTSPGNAQP